MTYKWMEMLCIITFWLYENSTCHFATSNAFNVSYEHRKKKVYVSILIVKLFNCIMCVCVYITFSSNE